LIIGRKDLIQACAFNSAPNHSIGRGMKVGKEEIMAFVTALDLWLAQDFTREMQGWEIQVSSIIEALSGIRGVTARRVYPSEPGIQPIWIPRVYIDWTPNVTLHDPEELQRMLLDGEPRVAVGISPSGLVVNPQMLEIGQERIVADCIKEVLTHRE
jgi:seryl-tRNA(Sec) selenium transferase